MKINGAGRRILVVDDDLAIRVLLQAVLTRMDFVVDLAEDGEMGLEALRQQRLNPDLILLDLMMPKINGYEFLREMDDICQDGRPHVIVFTAAGQRGIDKIPPDAVCNSILKPFDLETFVEMIGSCVDGHRSVSNDS